MFDLIEEKNEVLISKAKTYMESIDDKMHDISHMEDVVLYTKRLLEILDLDVDKEVCIISAYFHDVGRIKLNEGHEKLSADMLKEELEKLNYNENLIDKCYQAVVYHKWDMEPKTLEGKIVKDADKIGFIGLNRWKACVESKTSLDNIMELLPRLRDEFLYFPESRKIYDEEMVKLADYLYRSNYER